MVNLSENLQNRLRALSSFRKTSPTYKSQVQMNFSHTPMRKNHVHNYSQIRTPRDEFCMKPDMIGHNAGTF